MNRKNKTMKIGHLLKLANIGMKFDADISETMITGLAADSRYCDAGNLFLARKGAKNHGLDFIDQLIEKEVGFILYEGDYADRISSAIPAYRLDHQADYITQLAHAFYGQSIEKLSLVGVTGTEGKTSVTQFVAKALNALSHRCGVIGTNGMGFLPNLDENAHTTPDQLTLYQHLADIADAMVMEEREANKRVGGSTLFHPVALEVTSHALEQKRIDGLSFAVTALTNLSRDHLDYHGTIERYAAAKRKLFTDYPSKASVLNIEDPFGSEVMGKLLQMNDERLLFPYGEKVNEHPNYLHMRNIVLKHNGLQFNICYQGETFSLESSLYGKFNVYNLTATIGILLGLDLPIREIMSIIPSITNVRGRMERVALKNGAVGIVDYAHKPNALLQALQSLREHLHEGKLTVVFGCGGDRDRGKRQIMAAIAEENADQVIVTSDNPRTEVPEAIIDEIMLGFSKEKYPNIIRIADRGRAIQMAIDSSSVGDIILIAGKGHEDYQIIGNQTIHFSDLGELERFNRE